MIDKIPDKVLDVLSLLEEGWMGSIEEENGGYYSIEIVEWCKETNKPYQVFGYIPSFQRLLEALNSKGIVFIEASKEKNNRYLYAVLKIVV